MANEIILQHWIFRDFILPFSLVFAIIFAILERTKIFGEDRKQVNSIIAAVIGMIFVGVVYPKIVVENMILFLTVAIVVVFIFLMLYGFIVGDTEGIKFPKGMKIFFGILAGIAVILALVWSMNLRGDLINTLFYQPWSKIFWTNFLFILVIAGAIAIVLGSGKGK